MKIIEAVQGTTTWHKERQSDNRRTASEANAMMGKSSHCTRTQLLDAKKFGIEKEISLYTQRFIFDKGHEVEALARDLLESDIGEDLFPVTGVKTVSEVNLLASFDGLTLMDDTIYEHK